MRRSKRDFSASIGKASGKASARSTGKAIDKRFDKMHDAKIISRSPLFDAGALPADAVKIIDSFDDVVQSVFPMNARQRLSLPHKVRELSHELTDERKERKRGYLNAPASLSAYVHYFSWWNLIRLARLFANIGADVFSLSDGDVCLDIGSGPLTLVIALWLACPSLRNKTLTWYCLDVSQNALSLGENLYLSIAAKTPPPNANVPAHWNIVRVKSTVGTASVSLKQKAKLITCANLLNELRDADAASSKKFATPDEQADADFVAHFCDMLFSYADSSCAFFVVEPGVPRSAHVISLLRNLLLAKKMRLVAPCPHDKICPMNGLHARKGGKAKWCNFSFSTDDAPPALQKLSRDAGIPKARAVLSFLFATTAGRFAMAKDSDDERGHKKLIINNPVMDEFIKKNTPAEKLLINKFTIVKNATDEQRRNPLLLRVVSDGFALPCKCYGHYACSELGLTLVANISTPQIQSGDLIEALSFHKLDTLPLDVKSGAKILNV